MVVHERGYYLVDPMQGPLLYRDVVRRMEQRFGLTSEQVVEQEWFDYPGNRYTVPDGPVYIPWSSNEVNLPDRNMPNQYFMAIFDLSEFLDAYTGPPLPAAPEVSTVTTEEEPQLDHVEHVHQNVVPAGAGEHQDVLAPGAVEHVEKPPGAP